MRTIVSMTLVLALASGSASALESATTGSQATQATVGAINSKVDTSVAALQAQNTAMMKCMSQRKFYAPSDAKKDANGCVGVGDYDLNMASGSNVNLDNGQIKGSLAAAQYAGYFAGSNYGLRAQGNAYGLVGVATGNPSGDTVGVYGYTSTAGWGGYFYSPVSGGGNVIIYNGAGNAKLCLNSTCTTSLPTFGSYTYPNNGPGAYALWTGPYSFVCPGNGVMVGLAVTTAGTCSNKCNGDGPIIRNIQLICR